MINDILKTGVGLEGIVDVQVYQPLPEAKDLVHNADSVIRTEDLYHANLFERSVSSAFELKLSNPDLLQPVQIRHAFESVGEKLVAHSNQDVREFVEKDLNPLLENTGLLSAYMNMMVNG